MKQTTRRLSGDIPTSSMADVAFLLLIFFLISATFAAVRGLDMELPEEETAALEIVPEEAIRIEVGANRQVLLDSQPVSYQQLLTELGPKLAPNPRKPILLEVAPSAPYGAMVEVYDLLRGAREHLQLPQEPRIAIPSHRELEAYQHLWPQT